MARIVLHHRPAVRDGLAQARETTVLVGAIPRMVPADEVKKLVARREPHLSQALVGFHAGRQPDLIAIRPVPAAATRVVAIKRTTSAEGANLGGEACEGALDEPRPRCDVAIGLRAPWLGAQTSQPAQRHDYATRTI